MTKHRVLSEQPSLSQAEIKERISHFLGPGHTPKQVRIYSDTSDFYQIDYGDVVILEGRPYLIRNNEREGRFGIDEQQKYWVKRARDLTDGSTKILKLTFHERFQATVGGQKFDCFRSPRKEARILDIARGNTYFMQGFSVHDSAGNIVRILEYIRGKALPDSICGLGSSHEDYFLSHFPALLDNYTAMVEAIQFLHDHGEKHGDIRRDHILVEKETGRWIWIDFDFNYLHKENIFGYDLFGLGNILVYLAGRGDITVQDLMQARSPAYDRITKDDLNIIFNNRVVNLRKVFPYIPESLNLMLLHFSLGANVFYEDTYQFLNDLREARKDLL